MLSRAMKGVAFICLSCDNTANLYFYLFFALELLAGLN